jgi:transposase
MSQSPNEEPPPKPTRKRAEISPQTREEIVVLHDHYGSREIARRVGLSRKIVRRILEEAGRLSLMSSPTDKLSGFDDLIRSKVEKGLTTSRILREIREHGYPGGRTILAGRVRGLRNELALAPRKVVKRRFETRPGLEMQIDWSPYTVPIGGRPTSIRAFGAILGSSRKLWYHCYREERQHVLIEAIVCAFEYFEGAALRTVLDNMATAVLGRYGSDGKPIWQPTFLDVMRGYGSEPFACNVRDADRKGKKEKAFRLFWDDFLNGTDFESFDDLNERAVTWLDRTPGVANLRRHGTTGLVPNEAWLSERALLVPLPSKRFQVGARSIRAVDQDSTVSMGDRRYTVPSSFANKNVAVRVYAEHFELLDRLGDVGYSRRYVAHDDPRKLIIDESCYATLPRGRARASGRRLDDTFLARFPSLGALASGLRLRMKALAPIHFRALLRLSERYGETAFLQAATRAQEFRRFDSRAVGRILEKQGAVPLDEPPLLGGMGAVLIADVDSGTLDTYAALDSHPAAPVRNDTEDPHGS